MDKFMEFVTNKISTIILIILGIVIPGVLFLFIYKQDIFMELDFFKLILLSCAISIPTYVILLAGQILVDMIKLYSRLDGRLVEIKDIFINPLLINLYIFVVRIGYEQYKKKWDTRHFVIWLFITSFLVIGWDVIIVLCRVLKKKLKERKEIKKLKIKKDKPKMKK